MTELRTERCKANTTDIEKVALHWDWDRIFLWCTDSTRKKITGTSTVRRL
jgi:hypothetical protein